MDRSAIWVIVSGLKGTHFHGTPQERALVGLLRHPRDLRLVAGERPSASSAPTRGDRRRASRVPPFFGWSRATVARAAARLRAESGASPARASLLYDAGRALLRLQLDFAECRFILGHV